MQQKAHAGGQGENRSDYNAILSWFSSGNKIEIGDDMSFNEYRNELAKVKELREVTLKYMLHLKGNAFELASAMEFVIDALHQYSKIAKDEVEHTTVYKDLIGSIFQQSEESLEEES